MMSEVKKVFGIDLGTTYSSISYVDESGNPVIVKNMEGDSITPSVVFFESESNIVVGQVAKDTAALFPDKVVSFIKRSIGKSGFSYDYSGENITPEEISAYVLKKLANDTKKLTGFEVNDVVITCPAYFGINEREATSRAGQIAGLNVLSIIDEPVAAAVTYGCTKSEEDKVVLVFDLGGGTFDVTMIEVTKDAINVVCTGGDANLGGKNWDDAIMIYISQQFQEQTGVSADALFDDSEMLQELIIKAESTKKELTAKDKATIPLRFDGNKARVELTREKFDEITIDLLNRAILLTKEMLGEAEKKGVTKFDELLLVGGSARMPQVAHALRQEFGIEPTMFEPDESVSKGASIYGYMMQFESEKLRKIKEAIAEKTGESVANISSVEVAVQIEEGVITEDEVKQVENTMLEKGYVPRFTGKSGKAREINPVTSKSFGVKAFDQTDTERLFNLIIKNTNVPCEVSERFGTHQDNQLSVEIVILESEVVDKVTNLEMGVEIGNAVLEIPAGLPAGSPIDVTFKLNKEGLLEMKAVECTENRECRITIELTNGITEEELKAAVSRGLSIEVQ